MSRDCCIGQQQILSIQISDSELWMLNLMCLHFLYQHTKIRTTWFSYCRNCKLFSAIIPKREFNLILNDFLLSCVWSMIIVKIQYTISQRMVENDFYFVWKILLDSFLLSESFQCSDHISLPENIGPAVCSILAPVVDGCPAVVDVLIRIWRCLTLFSDFCVAIRSKCTVSIEWRVVRWTLSEAALARSALSPAVDVDLEWFSEAGSNQEEDDGWWRN